MTLAEIQTAVRNKQTVHWANRAYEVQLHHLKDGREQWLIVCTLNSHCIGLTHLDGATLNGRPDQFFVAP